MTLRYNGVPLKLFERHAFCFVNAAKEIERICVRFL